jgi:hypothetical protein
MATYKQIADVLDSVAEYIDQLEYTKSAAEQQARDERIAKLAAQYELATGEAVPAPVKEKLAALDHATLDHILKVAKNNSDSPESLGGPANIEDERPVRTVKEAAAAAEDRFLDWLIKE